MSERPRQDLREISHLFLSGIRERQTGGAPRPQRIGPGQRAETQVDLTPEEIAQVSANAIPAAGLHHAANVTAVLAGHFEHRQAERVRQFAAHAAVEGGRIGLIEVDANECRLSVYERSSTAASSSLSEPCGSQFTDVRRLAESLEELSWDVDHWIISLSNGQRGPEARDLLRRVGQFVLFSSCEPDGIVAAYRTLKGTADIVRRDARPALSLALFDAIDAAQASGTFEKIKGVAVQFLNWQVDREVVVESTDVVAEHFVLQSLSAADNAQSTTGVHWQVLSDFLDRAAADEPAAVRNVGRQPAVAIEPEPAVPPPPPQSTVIPMSINAMPQNDTEEIVELTGGDDAASVLSAVISGAPQQWIECPVRAPMCDDARLVVARDRSLTLLAVAKKGLTELRAIGQAYQWLSQNRSLICMALPQLSIDAHQLPRLQLLVDHVDASANVLQPMLHTGHVSVTAYRKVRFSGRRGLLLEAA